MEVLTIDQAEKMLDVIGKETVEILKDDLISKKLISVKLK